MRMLPFSKVSLKCEISYTSIKSYKLPKRLDLTINGYGYGKFTNKQMFENNSFKLKTSNPSDKFFNKLFGTGEYIFYISKKNTKYPETYMFSIPKKNKGTSIVKGDSCVSLISIFLLLYEPWNVLKNSLQE